MKGSKISVLSGEELSIWGAVFLLPWASVPLIHDSGIGKDTDVRGFYIQEYFFIDFTGGTFPNWKSDTPQMPQTLGI